MKLSIVLLSLVSLTSTLASPTTRPRPSPRGYVYTPLTPDQAAAVDQQIYQCVGLDSTFNATLITDPTDITGMRARISDYSDTLSELSSNNQQLQAMVAYQQKAYDQTWNVIQGGVNALSGALTARDDATEPTATASADEAISTSASSDPFLSTYADHMATMGIAALMLLASSASSSLQQTLTQLVQMQDCAKKVSLLQNEQVQLMQQAGSSYFGGR